MYAISSCISPQTPPLPAGSALRYLRLSFLVFTAFTALFAYKNTRSILRVVTLQVPGITSAIFPLNSPPSSNPSLPIPIHPPSSDSPGTLPFVASTFSHACPTRAPGDKTHLHSVYGAFFQGPMNAAEKARRMMRENCRSHDTSHSLHHPTFLHFPTLVEHPMGQHPARYTLSPEQMIENDYPMPSYMADVFQKPPGWIETPQDAQSSLETSDQAETKVYAIDCEMVRQLDSIAGPSFSLSLICPLSSA